jgi:Zn ribbon nucleic-acid-binding protein
MPKRTNQPSIDRAQRCPRCQIGPIDCRVGTPLSMRREDGRDVIFCPKCGYTKPDNPDTLKRAQEHPGDVTGGTNEPEKWETPC